MRYVLSFVLSCTMMASLLHVMTSRAQAQARADVIAQIDAGPSPETAAAPALVVPPPILKDPVDDPSGYAQDALGAFRAGQWAFLVVLGLFGLARGLLFVAAKWSIAWLKRATPALVAASAALASVGASLAGGSGFDLRATAGAVLMVAALYLSPAPKAAT